MSKFLMAAAALALAVGCATTDPDAPPVQYTVVDDDAAIPFANTVRGFRIGKDEGRSLLIEGGNGRWYRAKLHEYCQRRLNWEQKIALDTGPLNRFDRFSTVIVDGQRCQVVTLDEIADPDEETPPTMAPAT